MDQIKIYSQQLVAEALTQMRDGEVNSLPVYDGDRFVGKINYVELTAFLNQKEKLGSMYAHKMNFDIGTALLAIKKMKADMHKEPKRFSFGKQVILGLSAVAAAAVLLLGVTWFLFKSTSTEPLMENKMTVINANKLMLTLANGQNVELDAQKTGLIMAGANLNYNDGSQVGHQNITGGNSMVLNVPRGGTYQLTLPDGTKVWLNSMSSLSFPASFDGVKKRSVQLNGEAYFEVAKVTRGTRIPFIVSSKGQEIEVLGTHFNVSAYENEKTVKTTLLEGSVRVSPFTQKDKLLAAMDPGTIDPLQAEGGKSTEANVILKPNEEATLTGADMAVKTVDASEAMAWTNGEYIFRNMPLENVMRMVARWYDVEVTYQDKATGATPLGGAISKQSKIANVLKMLELTANVHFKIEGKKITVLE